MAVRKLSKTMRKLNLIQKVVMGILAGVSLMLASLTDTSEIYYQFVSVFSSAFPIVWSQILDACKDYESQETPTTLSPASSTDVSPIAPRTPKVESPHLHDLNDSNENTV